MKKIKQILKSLFILVFTFAYITAQVNFTVIQAEEDIPEAPVAETTEQEVPVIEEETPVIEEPVPEERPAEEIIQVEVAPVETVEYETGDMNLFAADFAAAPEMMQESKIETTPENSSFIQTTLEVEQTNSYKVYEPENGVNKIGFETGSDITLRPGLDYSSSNHTETASGLYTIVTIPKDYLDLEFHEGMVNVKDTTEKLLYEPSVTEDDNAVYVRYDFDTIAGGDHLSEALVIHTKNYETVPETQFTVKAETFTADHILLGTNEYMIRNEAHNSFRVNRSNTLEHVDSEESTAHSVNNKTCSDLEYLKVVESSFQIENDYIRSDNALKTGVYDPENIMIKVKLEDNVYFVQDYPGRQTWQYDNREWTYDLETNTISRVVKNIRDEGRSASGYSIGVKMKDTPYNEEVKVGTIEMIPLDEHGEVIPSDWITTMPGECFVKLKKYETRKKAILSKGRKIQSIFYTEENKDFEETWTITLTADDAYGTYITEMNDLLDQDVIPSAQNLIAQINHTRNNERRLYYTSAKITNVPERYRDTLSASLIGIKSNAEQEELSNVGFNQEYIIDSNNHLSQTDVYRGMQFKFEEPILLQKNEKIVIEVKTKMFALDYETFDSTKQHFLSGKKMFNADSFWNFAHAKYQYDAEGNSFGESAALSSYSIVPSGYVFFDEAAPAKNSQTILQGQSTEVSFSGKVNDMQRNPDHKTLLNPYVVILLPEGWLLEESEEGNVSVSYLNSKVTETIHAAIQYDYQETGKRALMIPLDENQNLVSPDSRTNTFKVNFQLKAANSTPDGESSIKAYLAYSNMGKYGYRPQNNYGNKKMNVLENDIFDMDHDGNTSEFINVNAAYLNKASGESTYGAKYVGKSLDKLFNDGIDGLHADENFWYGLEIANNQNNLVLRQASLIDILPYVGDKTVQANSEGVYTSRNSQFRVQLTGPVQMLADGDVSPLQGFKVLYSTAAVQDTLDGNLNSEFTETVDDYSKVTLFKVEMLPGTTIAQKQSVRFAVPVKVPGKKEIFDGAIAYNSFAWASSTQETGNLSTYLEVPRVFAKVVVPFSIEVNKEWKGGKEDQVTFRLYANGKEVGNQTIGADQNWTATFVNLERTDASGKEIVYTISEDEIEGYQVSIEGDAENGFTVTNEKINIVVPPTGVTQENGALLWMIGLSIAGLSALLFKKKISKDI